MLENIHPVIHDLVEEFSLSIKSRIQEILGRCYSIPLDQVLPKLHLLGLSVSDFREWSPTPAFYRLYRNLLRSRSTIGNMNSIARSGGQFEGMYDPSWGSDYLGLRVFRDYQQNELLSDGFLFVVLLDHRLLENNIIIHKFLPAGYTFAYVNSELPQDPSVIDDLWYSHLSSLRLHERIFISEFDGESLGSLVFRELSINVVGYHSLFRETKAHHSWHLGYSTVAKEHYEDRSLAVRGETKESTLIDNNGPSVIHERGDSGDISMGPDRD